MSEEQAPYDTTTTTTTTTLARAAHACRERVLHVSGELEHLLASIRAEEINKQAAQERCERLSEELRNAVKALEGPSVH